MRNPLVGLHLERNEPFLDEEEMKRPPQPKPEISANASVSIWRPLSARVARAPAPERTVRFKR